MLERRIWLMDIDGAIESYWSKTIDGIPKHILNGLRTVKKLLLYQILEKRLPYGQLQLRYSLRRLLKILATIRSMRLLHGHQMVKIFSSMDTVMGRISYCSIHREWQTKNIV